MAPPSSSKEIRLMARIRPEQPDGFETATDVAAETAETTSGDLAPTDTTAEDTEDQADDGPVQRFRVLRGINYPAGGGDDEKRAEPGDEVDDLPDAAVDGLLADGAIERI